MPRITLVQTRSASPRVSLYQKNFQNAAQLCQFFFHSQVYSQKIFIQGFKFGKLVDTSKLDEQFDFRNISILELM